MPIILDGTQGITFPDNSRQYNGYFGFKNRIINGDMRIDQRNAGASVTPTAGSYTLDRFQCALSQASKLTVQRNAGSVTPPTGFTNYLGVTSSSAYTVLSGDYFAVQQNIEGFNIADLGWGTANAQTVTLSFWVRSSLTGTFGGAITNRTGARSYAFTYSISVANTWEQKTITIAGDTSGTWDTNNVIGMQVQFGLGVGSTYSGSAGSWASAFYISATGATSVVGTNGATFYITGVQLEEGVVSTNFDVRPYGTELQLCQRYCYQVTSVGGTDAYVRYTVGECLTTTGVQAVIPLPVQMRITPSLTTPAASQFAAYTGSTIIAATAISLLTGSGVNTAGISLTVASGLTVGRAAQIMSNNNNTSYLLFSSEL